MNALGETVVIGGLTVELTRKRVRNINIRVCPPDGRVRVSVPARMGAAEIRRALSARLHWISRHRERILATDRSPAPDFVSGEQHYLLGFPFRLEVVEKPVRPRVSQLDCSRLEMLVSPGTGRRGREALLLDWYRRRLAEQVPALLARWEPVVGVKVNQVRIRRMKTLWGSCNIDARRICLSLELARRPACCLEYILVHEMVHFISRLHDERFHRLMTEFLPDWRRRREILDGFPAPARP